MSVVSATSKMYSFVIKRKLINAHKTLENILLILYFIQKYFTYKMCF